MDRAATCRARFRPFFSPAVGEWFTCAAIANDNNGELVRFASEAG